MEQHIKYDFRRDKHGNLRLTGFDSSKVPWPKKPGKKERRQAREAKFYQPV